MPKIAFICSGQGSQYAGMGRELYENFAEARAIYECAGDILGFDVAKTSFEGDDVSLSQTRISQPAIFALSMAAFAVVSQFCEPSAFAGHSLGEYAALTAAGAYSLENGFRVISARAAAMEKAGAENPGSMFAIIGSDEETIVRICRETGGFVVPVNFNSPAQTVIAGETLAAQTAADSLAGMGAKAVKLAVSCAFHTKLMTGASAALKEQISHIPASPMTKPFYSNVTGKLLDTQIVLTEYLAEHMVSPVYFHQEVSAMLADGIDTFVELGPNKVLSMLIKRSFKQASVYNVENCKSLEKLRSAL